MSVSTFSCTCFLTDMVYCPLAVETKERVNKVPQGWQLYHILISEIIPKHPNARRRIYAGECAVCVEEQYSHESFDLWTKLSSRKDTQGNQIIKLTPFGFCFRWFCVPSEIFAQCESVTCTLLIPLEGTAKKAFDKDNTSQRNFKL